jgi:hypothetical protein
VTRQGSELPVVPAFWTGGWDSSFRVLELLLRYRCEVQPIYVADPYRKSRQNEVLAMNRIREALGGRFPDAALRLRETIFLEKDELEISALSSQWHAQLRSTIEISWQYEWLAAVGDTVGFGKIEMSFQGNDTGPHFEFIRQHATKREYPCGGSTYELEEWEPTNAFEEAMQLFHHFTYPTIHTPKAAMDAVAEENGFADMLRLTWFCHYPIGEDPCGACSVCRHVVDANVTSPFSRSGLIRNKFWFLVHPTRLLVSNPERAVERVRDQFTWLRSKLSRT